MTNIKLKKLIDKMVAESIRQLLPEIMNEVLIKTIVNARVMTEAPKRASVPPPQAPKRPAKRPSMSMVDLLEEDAGAEFYRREEPVMQMEIPEEIHPQIAQRITQLPPGLRELAEDSMESIMMEEVVPEVNLQQAGLDFSRMRAAMGLVEERAIKPVAKDPRLEEARIERNRQMLESKRVG